MGVGNINIFYNKDKVIYGFYVLIFILVIDENVKCD